MSNLKELKERMLEAQKLYFAHPNPSEQTSIESDIECTKLLRAFTNAQKTYEEALRLASMVS